ncbi:hypothetical protein [Acinetobacter modestus]|uniref:beta strand repeat-containing protein n=1 Tax=Acinetobacter modestus TaxID=1776740 RepID=UPI003019274A
MLFKSLLSPIKSITSNLLESNTTTSSITGSTLAPLSLSSITNIVSTSSITNIVSTSSITNTVNQTISTVSNSIASSPISTITSTLGSVTGSSSPLSTVTNIVSGVTGGTTTNPVDTVTNIVGGITGGIGTSPLNVVTNILGATGSNPVNIVTGIIGGVTGGDLSNNPVTSTIQTTIDTLQGVESLKTSIINSGIHTVADAVIGTVHQSEHPIGDLANLGTLTFETSRDTVNGSLEAVSNLAGADINGAIGSATGVIGTLINNGSTASNTVQHIVGDLTDISSGSPVAAVIDIIGGVTGSVGGNPLDAVTNIIGGVTGGVGGNPLETVTDLISGITGGVDGNPLDAVTNIIGGVTGGVGGNPLDAVTDLIGGITGGDLGNNPVTGIIQTGIDVLQGVESLKTEIINTGINTVGGVISGVLPQVHPIVDLTNLGTLTFETSRDTVNGTLEAISDLAGADINGAVGSASGVIGTLINNGTTASSTIQHIVGDLTDLGSSNPLGNITDIIGSITGGVSGNPLDVVTDIIGGVTGGVGGNPLEAVTDIIGGVTGGIGGNPLDAVTDIIGGVTGGVGGNPLDAVTDIIGGITGGVGGNPIDAVADIIGGVTGGGVGGNPLDAVTDIIGSVTGGVGGNPLDAVTGIIGGVTGGVGGNPLDAVTTGIIGGITGGDLANNPITGAIQTGIDILQGVESLKTEIINTGINTVADTIISAVPQVEHPVGDLADLGTLSFETSRDTVNGTLEAISDLSGGDLSGVLESATGVVGTLINNSSSAADILQHITNDFAFGNPLDIATGVIDGITGSISGSQLGSISEIITNIGNGFDSGDVISGIAQPIQTGITNANLAIDTLQDNLTNLASDSTFETIDSLINVNLGGGDYHISGSVDSILNAITGTVSSTIAVGEPNPNGGSVTDLISLPSQLTSLTDNLFSSINHF